MRTQREFQRRPSRHPVSIPCQVVRERDFRLVADQVMNLSTWGMLVSPADPVVTGEKVFVSFKLPGGEDWVDACATVTRVIHGRRPTETSRMLGLEFDDMSHYDRYRLRRALAKRPVTPPGVRQGRRGQEFSLEALAA